MELTTQRLLMGAAGASTGDPYWIGEYTSSLGSSILSLRDVTENGVIFSAGTGTQSGLQVPFLMRVDKSGAQLGTAQSQFSSYVQSVTNFGQSFSGGGFMLIGDSSFSSGGGGSRSHVTVYNEAGTTQSAYRIGSSGQQPPQASCINPVNLDPYVIIGSSGGTVARLNRSGGYISDLWTISSGSFQPKSIAIDSNQNMFLMGDRLFSYNLPTNTINFNRYASSSTFANSSVITQKAVVDSSGSVYYAGYGLNNFNTYRPFIAKANSSGVFEWGYYIAPPSSHQIAQTIGLEIDRDGNLYWLVETNNFTGVVDRTHLFKLNSSGSQIWKRTFRQTNGTSLYISGMKLTKNGTPIVSFTTSANAYYLASLPPDGTGTGTYGNIVYSAGDSLSYPVSLSITYANDPFVYGTSSGANEYVSPQSDLIGSMTRPNFYSL